MSLVASSGSGTKVFVWRTFSRETQSERADFCCLDKTVMILHGGWGFLLRTLFLCKNIYIKHSKTFLGEHPFTICAAVKTTCLNSCHHIWHRFGGHRLFQFWTSGFSWFQPIKRTVYWMSTNTQRRHTNKHISLESKATAKLSYEHLSGQMTDWHAQGHRLNYRLRIATGVALNLQVLAPGGCSYCLGYMIYARFLVFLASETQWWTTCCLSPVQWNQHNSKIKKSTFPPHAKFVY